MEEAGRDLPSDERLHERISFPGLPRRAAPLAAAYDALADRCLAKRAAVHLVRLSEDRDAFLSLLQRDE